MAARTGPGFDPQHSINWARGSSLQPQQNSAGGRRSAGGPESQGHLGVGGKGEESLGYTNKCRQEAGPLPRVWLSSGNNPQLTHQYERGWGGDRGDMMLSFGLRGKAGLCHKGLETGQGHGHSRLVGTVPKHIGHSHNTVDTGSVLSGHWSPFPQQRPVTAPTKQRKPVPRKLFAVSQAGLGSGEKQSVLGPRT